MEKFTISLSYSKKDDLIRTIIKEKNYLLKNRNKKDFNFIQEEWHIFSIMWIDIWKEERLLMSFSKKRDFIKISNILWIKLKNNKFHYEYDHFNLI